MNLERKGEKPHCVPVPKRHRQQLHLGLDNFFSEGEATLASTTQSVPHSGHPGPLY